jgi:hypothetical protein
MLINAQGKQVFVAPGKELGEYARRQLREVYSPLPYKRHPFFSIEQRARVIS